MYLGVNDFLIGVGYGLWPFLYSKFLFWGCGGGHLACKSFSDFASCSIFWEHLSLLTTQSSSEFSHFDFLTLPSIYQPPRPAISPPSLHTFSSLQTRCSFPFPDLFSSVPLWLLVLLITCGSLLSFRFGSSLPSLSLLEGYLHTSYNFSSHTNP